MVLLAISTPTNLSLFDQDPSQPLQLPSPIAVPSLDGPVVCSAWSRERGAFAVATSEGSVYIWEDAAGRPKEWTQVVKGLKDDLPITTLLLDSHEGLVALYSQGSKVHVVDCRSFKKLAPLEHYPSLINNISLSSDGLAVAAGHESGQVVIFNRQHGTHSSISLSSRAPVTLTQLHPSKRNTLLIVQRSTPSKLLVYDVLRTSSPLKTIPLANASSTGNVTALSFHGSGSHVAVVTDAGELFTANLESGSKRETSHKVPLTSVVWTGRSSVVLGTETGRLLLRDAQNESLGSDFTLGEGGDPIVSLSAQPTQSSKPVPKKKTLGESSVINQSSAQGRGESTTSRRMSKSSSADNHASTSYRPHLPQSTPSSTSNASSTYNPTPSSSTHASSYKSFSDIEPTPSHPSSRPTQPAAARGSGAAAKPKRVLFGDETHDGGGSGADESTPRRSTSSPPPSRSSRPSPPRPIASSSSRLREDQTSSPTHNNSTYSDRRGRMSASDSHSNPTSRSPSPPPLTNTSHTNTTTSYSPAPPRQQHVGGDDSPLIYAMSAQIRDLHLDMLKARRETRREMKGLFKQHFGEMKELREENERLKRENDRLRRGY